MLKSPNLYDQPLNVSRYRMYSTINGRNKKPGDLRMTIRTDTLNERILRKKKKFDRKKLKKKHKNGLVVWCQHKNTTLEKRTFFFNISPNFSSKIVTFNLQNKIVFVVLWRHACNCTSLECSWSRNVDCGKESPFSPPHPIPSTTSFH